MQEPPGELVATEHINLCRMTSEIMLLWASYFFNRNSGTLFGHRYKNDSFHQNLVVFPKATNSENKTI